MNDNTELLNLLGIPTDVVGNFNVESDNETGISNIYIELLDKRGICPKCGSHDIGIKGYYHVHIKNSIVKRGKMYVDIRVRRFVCRRCHHSFKQKYNFYNDRRCISTTIRQSILESLKEPHTYIEIAKEHDVSPTYVMKLFDSLKEIKRLPLSEVICVDEFHFAANKKGFKYPAVITNPYTDQIIDVIDTRRKDYLFEYFLNIPEQERAKVSYFITDMYEIYRQVKKRFFPRAIHIVDRFHIAKLFTEAIQSVRKTIMKQNEYGSKEYRYLKDNWKLFVMKRDKLNKLYYTDKYGVVHYSSDDVDLVLRKYPELNQVYATRNEFFARGHQMLWLDSKKHVDFFIGSLKYHQLTELQSIAKTLENWEFETTNAFARSSGIGNLSNAVAEATNNIIQTYSDIGYGFKNFRRFRKRILYMNRNKHQNH